MLTRCDHTRMADRRTLSEIPGGQTTGSAQYHGVAPATARSPDFSSGTRARKESRCADEAELLQGRYASAAASWICDRAWKMEKCCLAWKICLSAFGMGMIGSNEAVTFPLLLTCCLLLSYVRPSRIPR